MKLGEDDPPETHFFEHVINSATDGVFAYDTEFRYTLWNPAMEELTGFLKEEVLGKEIFEIFPPNLEPEQRKLYEDVLEGRNSSLEEWPIVVPRTQQQRLIEIYFSPLRAHKKIIGGVGVVRDITQYQDFRNAALVAEQSLRSLFDASSDVMAIVSLDGMFTSLNPAWEELTGWSVEEGLKMKFISVVHPDDRAPFLEGFQALIQGKSAKPIHVRAQRKEGGQRLVEVVARSISKNGRIMGVLAVCRDVTDKKAGEDMLRTWAHIFRNMNVGIKIDDAEGKTVRMVNPAYAFMHGYTQEEVMNTPTILQYPKELKQELANHHAILRKNGYHVFDSIHVRKDGSTFPVSIEATLIKDQFGVPQYRALLVRDITSRRELEYKLSDYTRDLERKIVERTKELEGKLAQEAQEKAEDEALLSSIGEGVIVTDERGRIIFINHQTEQLLGWESPAVVGKNFSSLLVITDRNHRKLPADRQPIRLALKDRKKTTTSDYFYVRSDGTDFPVALTTSPVTLGEKIIGAMTVFRDITKEKEVDRVKSEFVSLASHQLRTPLSTINWYAESLLNGKMAAVDARQKRYIEQIYNASRRMVKLIHDLLHVSRLELGTFGLNPERLKVSDVIHQVLSETALQVKARHLNVIEQYDRKAPLIDIDRQLAHIVFENLITNAIKYTDDGGTITVETAYWPKGRPAWVPPQCPNAPLLICAVTDSGYGIPKAVQGQVFTKFFRAANVKEKDQDGTGLGLYIVKSLVTLLKGAIWFESPGSTLSGEKTGSKRKGTTFYVAIPVGSRKLF